MLNKLSQTKSSNHGFTLVELLISIAIVVIVSAVGIAGFNSASQNSAVKSQAQEIKTLIRKLRTDAGAALKPITGATTATSCKSPVAGDTDAGVVSGSYIKLSSGLSATSVTYGISCFDSTGASNLSSTNTLQLKSGLKLGNATYPNLTAFFGFDGEVKFLQVAILPPSKAQIDGASLAGVDRIPVTVTNGADINSGVRRQVSINRNGLICDETYSAVGAVVCAAL